MVRDSEATKQRLLDAATVEFAAHGRDGTTVERIARRAGVNKERLYSYYGDKNDLFATVLRAELAKVAAAVPFSEVGDGDPGEFAGRTFDYHQTHPELARLLAWEGLIDTGRVPDEAVRTAHYQAKVDAMARAQAAGVVDDELDPAHTVFLITALAGWWAAAPQVARMLAADDRRDGDPGAERARRRAAVVAAARRLTAPCHSPALPHPATG